MNEWQIKTNPHPRMIIASKEDSLCPCVSVRYFTVYASVPWQKVKVLLLHNNGKITEHHFNAIEDGFSYLRSRNIENPDPELLLEFKEKYGPQYKFYLAGDCTAFTGDEVNYMRDKAHDTSLKDLLEQGCDVASWATSVCYTGLDWGDLPLSKDFMVTYHRSFYDGERVYFIGWSGYEIVWRIVR